MSNLSNRQMNIPVHTRHESEIQTDVNLLGAAQRGAYSSGQDALIHQLFDFATDNRLSSFSDYYILSQLTDIISKVKDETKGWNEYKSQALLHDLTRQVHGLLCKELRLSGNNDYYALLQEKMKDLDRLHLRYGYFESKSNMYESKIADLEREIDNLRRALQMYQGASAENEIYKEFFASIKDATSKSRIKDIQNLLKEVGQRINECEINLGQLSKSSGRDRNKMKGAISRYAVELDGLSKDTNLDWETLSKSAASFFTAIDHLNSDDWIQHRLSLASDYEQLKNRHTAFISLVKRNMDSETSKSKSDILEFIKRESQSGIVVTMAKDLVGLGVVHCHRGSSFGKESEIEFHKYKQSVLIFQRQIHRLIDKFPQLKGQISAELRQFLQIRVVEDLIDGGSLGWLKEILVKETQVVTVENTYSYYSKTDKDLIFHLRVLLKALIIQLQRIAKQTETTIQLDEGLMVMISDQILDGCDIESILALFRPATRVCEVDVVIDRPSFIRDSKSIAIPLRQEEGIPLNSVKHVPVPLSDPKIFFGEKPAILYEQVPIAQKEKQDVSYPVSCKDERVRPRVFCEKEVVEVTCDRAIPVHEREQIEVCIQNEVVAERQTEKIQQIPYETVKTRVEEVYCDKEVPKYLYQDVCKIVKVPEYIPVIQEKPLYEIVEKKIPYILNKPDVVYIDKKEVVFEKIEVPKIIEELRDKTVVIKEHCDCKKPEPVPINIEKQIVREVEKQIIVEKCHYVKGDEIQKIVEVQCFVDKPLIEEIVVPFERCVEKLVPLHTFEEKMVIVEKEIPKVLQRYQPVPVYIEKPLIICNEEVKEVKVEVPVPIYIEKQIVKVVKCIEEKIVEKVVEVPRVEIIEKEIPKIITIPRIVEKIVTIPQIIEKVVTVECPVLEVVTFPVEKLCIQKTQSPVQINLKEEILKIEKEIQIEEVQKPFEIRVEFEKLVECERIEEVPVQIIKEIPREVCREKVVQKVVHTRECVPVETIVQIPLHIEVPVPVEIEKPVFYKQTEEFIHEVKVIEEKIVPVYETKCEVHEVFQDKVVHVDCPVDIPGETIILYEPRLEIVELEKEKVVAYDREVQKPVEKYLSMQKPVVISQQEFVQPEKVVEYLARPVEVQIQKGVPMKHYKEVPVEMTNTITFSKRDVDRVVEVDRCVTEILKTDEKVVRIPETHEIVKEVAYKDKEDCNVQFVEKEILRVNEEKYPVEVYKQKVIDGLVNVIREVQIVPEYFQKVVEKIIMLPQVVEIEKKCYLIEEINSLIAKEVDIQVYTREYKQTVDSLKISLDEVLNQLRSRRDRGLEEIVKLMQKFRGIVYAVDKMPKIVETIKEVVVEVEKDRPVLIPVFNSEQEMALELIIHELISGISKFNEKDINANFDQSILSLFNIEFQSGDSGFRRPEKEQERGRGGYGRSWIRDYDKQMPETAPLVYLSDKFRRYYQDYCARGSNFADLVSSFERHYLRDYNRYEQSQKIVDDQKKLIEKLQKEILDTVAKQSTMEYLKDKMKSDVQSVLHKFRELVAPEQYESIVTESIIYSQQSQEEIIRYGSTLEHRGYGTERRHESIEYRGERPEESSQSVLEREAKISEIYQQLSYYESTNFQEKQKVSQLSRENQMLMEDLKILRSSIPTTADRSQIERINRQWDSRMRTSQENYEQEIKRLRQQVDSKRYETSTATNEAMNENRRLSEELRNIKKEYNDVRQAHDRCAITLQNEKNKLIEEYERRLKGSTAPSSIERDLRREVDNLKRSLEAEKRKQEDSERRYEGEKKKAVDDSQRRHETEKKRIIDDYERRMSSSSGSQERELRREVEHLKSTLQNVEHTMEQNWESQRHEMNRQHEQKIRSIQNKHQQEIEKIRATSSRRQSTAVTTPPEKMEEIRKLKDTVKKLQEELDTSKREIETYQKSRLGHTTYTSGVKHRHEEEFQSPAYEFRSGYTEKYQSPEEGHESGVRMSESQSGRRTHTSGVKHEEAEEVRSSSSRFSRASETTAYKTNMTIREFMNIKKDDEKDSLSTLVMIKVIEKIGEQAKKDIINSYSPSNIYLSNFNPNNIDGLIVRFGAPITNRNSKTDGIYLAPEILRGEPTNLKSVVFTLAVIWDELIHSEIYFKTLEEVSNLSHQFKVRDSRLNPILKNTLFEMMSKDPAKRLELQEAKRRLSLQRYILSEGKAVGSSSRVSSQVKRER